MAAAPEKAGLSPGRIEALSNSGAIRSRDLSRTHRERLLQGGFLREALKGWYYANPSGPDADPAAQWRRSFWPFCAAYLNSRFGKEWCVGPEQSLMLHAGNRMIPPQLMVRAPGSRNRPTELPHGTSIYEMRLSMPDGDHVVEWNGMRLFSLEAGLVAAPPGFFVQKPVDARVALCRLAGGEDLLAQLLAAGRTVVAARLAGALRNIGRGEAADVILDALRKAGHSPRESDPFTDSIALPAMPADDNVTCLRMRVMWTVFRKAIPAIANAGAPVGREWMDTALAACGADAALFIAAEQPTGIEALARGETDTGMLERYAQAFHAMTRSAARVLAGENAGAVAREDHCGWMLPLGPGHPMSPASGLPAFRVTATERAGSRHPPTPVEDIEAAMACLFDLMQSEPDPIASAVIGHLMAVQIQPFAAFNDVFARFLLNLALAAAGQEWKRLPADRIEGYRTALEHALVADNIVPLTRFLVAPQSAARDR